MRLWIVGFALHLAAACATTDDRPQTLAYVTETILAPKCATAECHSNVRQQSGYIFDTVEHAQNSIANEYRGSVGELILPGFPATDQPLLQVLGGVEDPNGNRVYPIVDGDRMPLDEPLPNLDLYFIGNWIKNGADGYVPPPGP